MFSIFYLEILFFRFNFLLVKFINRFIFLFKLAHQLSKSYHSHLQTLFMSKFILIIKLFNLLETNLKQNLSLLDAH